MSQDHMTGVDQSESLEHYGRKGQKWGVRNGPPYPLDAEKTKDYNKDVDDSYNQKLGRHMNRKHELDGDEEYEEKEFKKKVKKNIVTERFEDLAKHDGPRTEAELLKARYEINHRDRGDDNSETFYLGRTYNCPNCAVAFEMTERGYDVTAKPADYGSNVGNIARFFQGGKLEKALGKYSWYKMTKQERDADYEEQNRIEAECQKRCSEVLGDINYRDLPYKEQMKLYDEKLKPIFDEFQPRWDAIAAKTDREYREFARAQKAAVENMEKKLKSYGNGARGIIVVGWPNGVIKPGEKSTSFHAFNWANEDGVIMYHDAQSRREWKYETGYTNGDFMYGINPNELYTMRTDNLELSPSVVEAVNSRR